MALFTVYIRVDWHDRTLFNSYYQVSAETRKEARKKVIKIAKEENAPSPQAKLHYRTSFKGFLPNT